jgi:hypothetical protein
VPEIVEGVTFNLPRAHRQHRGGGLPGLDLRLLVDAQDQGVIRWDQIEPEDVAHLLHEQRIMRQLERFGAVRLEGEGAPDPRDRALAQACGLGERASTPVCRVARRRLQGQHDSPLNVGIGDRARCSRAWLIQQAVEPAFGKALAPGRDGRPADLQCACHRAVGGSGFGARQHNPRPQGQSLGGFSAACLAGCGNSRINLLYAGSPHAPNQYVVCLQAIFRCLLACQRLAFCRGEFNWNGGGTASHDCLTGSAFLKFDLSTRTVKELLTHPTRRTAPVFNGEAPCLLHPVELMTGRIYGAED